MNDTTKWRIFGIGVIVGVVSLWTFQQISPIIGGRQEFAAQEIQKQNVEEYYIPGQAEAYFNFVDRLEKERQAELETYRWLSEQQKLSSVNNSLQRIEAELEKANRLEEWEQAKNVLKY